LPCPYGNGRYTSALLFLSLSLLLFNLYMAIPSPISILCLDLALVVFVHLFLSRFGAFM
jgi:hypothetical protein